ncbi:MAG TPA: hypothetical protein VD788_13840, partial [Candidatus Polarisedimenticolaceae bacterium]|nr:hypothetical protein [Candidatus Polarisedimenticolaceae bacterium]
KVTEATPTHLFVLGPDEAHAAIVEMLAERDPAVPAAQGFEVTLVRAVRPPAGDPPGSFPPRIATALRGLLELMPDLRFEPMATGSVRTSDRGRIRLATENGERYVVEIEYRSRRVGLERTELSLAIEAERDSNNPNLRDLLATSLSVFVGETVVVGSSTTSNSQDPMVLLLLTVVD